MLADQFATDLTRVDGSADQGPPHRSMRARRPGADRSAWSFATVPR